MSKKLSIIIITYNEEKNIGNILNDLLNQTFKNFEVIVSDSNSSDGTKKVVNSFNKKFSNLKFENCKKTLGPSYGRNCGVKFAKFERLLFFDADTRILNKNFLNFFLDFVDQNKIDSGSFYFGQINKDFKENLGYSFMNLGLFITQYFSPTGCGAFMFSTKKVHKKIGGFREDVSLCEDCDYLRDAKKTGFKIKIVPLTCGFSNRRLKQDGFLKTGFIYLKANLIRFITRKSIKKEKIEYKFGHYKD